MSDIFSQPQPAADGRRPHLKLPLVARGFTLIELLIVVGIIAILAAIAVPNLLEAQIRSKVARARADMRTIATAVEAYAVDANRYPANQEEPAYRPAPSALTTPVAYMTALPMDPFRSGASTDLQRRYEYNNVADKVAAGISDWPPTDLQRYGDWRLASMGPAGERMPHMPYDATNGTVSAGNVLRTQRSPEGRVMFTFWDPNNPTV